MLEQKDILDMANMAMPFGKYQGRVLIDLPDEYLIWFANKGFPQGRLGQLMALTLECKANGLDDVIKPLRGTQKTD
jgi:uncharacterized protein (DUF3820 family)